LSVCAEENISVLIDQLQQAVQNRGSSISVGNNIAFAIEEPIAWIKIFNFDINRYFTDPDFYFEQTLRQKLWLCEHFPEYAAHVTAEIPAWLGHYPEYTFVGLNVAFNSAGVPVIQSDHPLSCSADMKLLKPVDFRNSGWMPRVLKWYDEIVRIAAGRIKVTFNMEWWRGCLDIAIQLRGLEHFLTDTVERPSFVHDLLVFLTDQRCLWHQSYCHYFGTKLKPASIGDDWINVPFISPAIFDDFVLPRYMDIERFHGSIEYLHSCGNQTPLQKSIIRNLRTLQILEISPWTDLNQSIKNIPAEKKLNINLHPNDVLVANAATMRSKLEGIVRICEGRKYKVNTSGLTPISPDMSSYIYCIREWLKIARDVLKANTWESV
jgi:uroporphyrinogen-III decarboxylase